MEVDRSTLLSRLEKQLGRELTPSEVHLILLAGELIEKEIRPPAVDKKAAGAE